MKHGSEFPRGIQVLLRLFPPAFLERFGPELADSIRRQHEEIVRVGGSSGFLFWVRTSVDLLGTAALERIRQAKRWVASFIGEVSLGGRALRRRPGYAVAAIGTLSLGIAGATGMITILQETVLAPLPYEAPEELAMLFNDGRTARPDFDPYWPVSREQFETFAGEASSVSATTWIANSTSAPLIQADYPEEVPARAVAWNFFSVLGVDASLGRVFEPDDEALGEDVVVLSRAVWDSRFGSDPSALGATIHLRGKPRTIIGVLPEEFRWYGEGGLEQPQFWIPGMERETGFYDRWLLVRLTPGRTLEDARLDFGPNAWEYFTNDGYKDQFEPRDAASARTLREHHLGSLTQHIPALTAGVGLVLCLAALSVALLLLGRMASVEQGLAVRCALGASSARILLTVASEGIWIVGAGSTVGLLGGTWLLGLLLTLVPPGLPGVVEATVQPSTALSVVVVSFLVLLLVTATPAWFVRRVEPSATLRRGRSMSAATAKGRQVLVGFQVAGAMILLLSASLLLRSWRALATEDLGFEAEDVVVAQLELPADGWRSRAVPAAPASRDDEDGATIQVAEATGRLMNDIEALRRRLAALPGVETVAIARYAPLTGRYGGWTPLTPEGWENREWSERPHGTAANWVEPSYFDALGMRPIRGRLLTPADGEAGAPPVAVVTESFARLFWPGESGLGRRFYAYGVRMTADGRADDGPHLVEIVGIVPPVRERSLRDENVTVYLPYRPSVRRGVRPAQELSVLLRTRTDPGALAPEVRRVAAQVFPTRPLLRLEPLEATVEAWQRETSFVATLLTSFGVYGLLVSLVGIVGVVAFHVRRRRREVGIRIALGARWRQIHWLFAREVLVVVGAGVVTGTVVAILGAGFVEAWLYRVGPLDEITFVLVPALVLGAALAATVSVTHSEGGGGVAEVLIED